MTLDHTPSAGDIRDAVIDRYSAKARTALAGGAPVDCEPDAFADGCFGAAAYPGADAPDAALRASLGCGNPLAVAALQPGETVLDLGSGGGRDVLLSARRVGPAGRASWPRHTASCGPAGGWASAMSSPARASTPGSAQQPSSAPAALPARSPRPDTAPCSQRPASRASASPATPAAASSRRSSRPARPPGPPSRPDR
jgi:hypothetical protein